MIRYQQTRRCHHTTFLHAEPFARRPQPPTRDYSRPSAWLITRRQAYTAFLTVETCDIFFERLAKVGAILVKDSGCSLFETLHPHEERGASAHAAHDGRAYLRKAEEVLQWRR